MESLLEESERESVDRSDSKEEVLLLRDFPLFEN